MNKEQSEEQRTVRDVYVRKLFITPFRKYLYLKSDECKHNIGPVFTCSNRKLSVKYNMTVQCKKNVFLIIIKLF